MNHKISSIRHVGMVVRDLNTSLKFYNEILGLSIYRRVLEKPGKFIDDLVRIKNVQLEWVKLVIPAGGLIELIQYHSSPDSDLAVKPEPLASDRLGCSHVALTVKDLSKLYNELISNGYLCNSEPLISPEGKAKILYCHDPDGIILELIEDLS